MKDTGTRSVATVALMASLSFACGGGESAPVVVSAPSPPPAASKPAPKKLGLEGVKERGALRVAADPDAPPFLSKSAQGAYEGYEYAIMQAIAARAGVPVQIVGAPFPELPGKLTSGEADVIIGQLSPSSAYEGLAYSTSYLQYSLCLVVGKASKGKALADFKGKRIGMYDDPLPKQIADFLVGGAYEPVLFQDYGYFEMLSRGQLDAMLYDCPLARYEMKVFGDSLAVADDAINVTTYNVAVSKDDKKLLSEVNGVLQDLGNSGLLAKSQEVWLADSQPKGDYETKSGKVVMVKKGDTLGSIAERELGSKDAWQTIYDANKDVVGPDPDVVYEGMRLRLPKKG